MRNVVCKLPEDSTELVVDGQAGQLFRFILKRDKEDKVELKGNKSQNNKETQNTIVSFGDYDHILSYKQLNTRILTLITIRRIRIYTIFSIFT